MRPSPSKPTSRRGGLTLVGLCAAITLQLWLVVAEFGATVFASNGRAAQQARVFEIAERSYESSVAWYPFDWRTQYAAGQAYERTGHFEDAAQSFERGLRLAPSQPFLLTAHAERLIEQRDYGEAEAVLGYAEEIVPAGPKVHAIRGVIAGRRDGPLEAAKHFARAVELSPIPDPRVLNQLANALYDAGDYEGAYRRATAAIRQQELYSDHYLVRGKALAGLGRYREAAKDFGWAERGYVRRAGESDAAVKLIDLRRNLFYVWLYQGRSDRAAMTLADLATDPEGLGHVIELRLLLTQSLTRTLPASVAPARYHFARAMFGIGDYLSAEQLTAQAYEHLAGEDQFACGVLRARALTALGRAGEAFDVLGSLPSPPLDELSYRIALADAYAASGKPAAARVEYNAVLGNADLDAAMRADIEARRDALADQ